MVRCLALAAALLLATSATAQTCPATSCFEAPVVAVADGDTVTVLRQTAAGPRQVRVRLTEIDAPERRQPWGARARQALADKVFGRTVQVAESGEDRYGRRLARLYVADGDTLTGRDVNREMVREGHAWVFEKHSTDGTLVDDQRLAKQRSAGLWSLPAGERAPPWEWRAGERSIDLLLQSPLSYDSPADRCSPPACTRLENWLNEARRTIDFAIYGARNQSSVLAALIDAKRRGVRIRGYVDRTGDGHNYYASTDEWVRQLGGIADDRARESPPDSNYWPPACKRPVGFTGPLQCLAYDLGSSWLLAEHASRENFANPASGGVNKIMHNKFFVIDEKRVWTGSANLSDSGTGGYNANVVAAVESKRLASLYRAEFERLLARGQHKDKVGRKDLEETTLRKSNAAPLRIADADVSLMFAPQDQPMNNGVRPLIAAAQQSIDVAIFFLTHKGVVADLIAAHRRGVRLRVIVDATSANNGYTKHELLRTAGVPTKIENWGGKMHAKAAVIDGEYLVLGSMNWTSAGEHDNDENTLLIRSPRLAAHLQAWFDDLWQSIPDIWLASYARPDPESRDSGNACSDQVDNDFDDLVDDDDPGCRRYFRPPLRALPPHRVVGKVGADPPSTHQLQQQQRDWSICPHPLLKAGGRCPETHSGTLVDTGADAVKSKSFQCGTKRRCGEMNSCPEARSYLTQCGLSHLDGDGDGTPCEALCRTQSTSAAVTSTDLD